MMINERADAVGEYQSSTRRDVRRCGGRTRCPGDSGMRQGI